MTGKKAKEKKGEPAPFSACSVLPAPSSFLLIKRSIDHHSRHAVIIIIPSFSLVFACRVAAIC